MANQDVVEMPPRADSIDDAAYIDFMVALRGYAQAEIATASREAGSKLLEGNDIYDMNELSELLDPVPEIAVSHRIMRSQQEMTWRRVIENLKSREAELVAELDAADTQGPGSVHYDPNFNYPDWYTSADIHLQTGNYQGNPLAGYVYHLGTNVFYVGRNDHNQAKIARVNSIPIPQDGVVNSVLDLACSIGQSSTALKDRFPDAKIVGVDLAAPMVRYAHKRAVDLGYDIEFRQESSGDLSFADGSFDMVYANILFHEIPRDVAEATVKEAFRVLRPGGIFVVIDFPSYDSEAPLGLPDYGREFDSRYNGEPFASAFVYSDFEGMLRSVFDNVEPNYSPGSFGFGQARIATR